MKISYNWLRDYIQADVTPELASEILTSIGLEVESLELVESISGGLKGVVVGHVVECIKHPDADRLSLTKVDVGGEELLPIVCGAPNVAAGQKVLVATIGTMLYPKGGEPFQIKKGKIRGQESHGMICAEDELGLGESHAGIMILDESLVPGTPAAIALNIKSDYCIEIGLTPNRTDAISHIGVARDLNAALNNMEGIQRVNSRLNYPQLNSADQTVLTAFTVIVENANSCPRYCGVVIDQIQVGPSPEWLKERLSVIGLRPINNIVDITNYIQHECGQPLHAFDADKIKGGKVVVRNAREGETLVLLDGVEKKLSADDLMICDESDAMCLAGIFGGLHSGVTETTKKIFLESAYFDAVSIRKSAKRHGLHTDASFRFERGCDMDKAPWALQRAMDMIVDICGASVVSKPTDDYPVTMERATVNYNWQRTSKLIGKDIPKEKVKSILSSLEIDILHENEDELSLSIPLYRTDVKREADVVEEVLRIYGFNNIDFPARLTSSLSYAPKPDPEKIQNKVADMLMSCGFSEMMSLSLTKQKYQTLASESEYMADSVVELLNPLSGDLAAMRQTLIYNGLEAISMNQNFKNSDLRLFEFGKEYRKINQKYTEENHLALFLSGRKNPESWNSGNEMISFSDLKSAVEKVLAICGITDITYQACSASFYSDAVEFFAGKNSLVKCGYINDVLLKEFDVKNSVLVADFNWAMILKSLPKNRIQYKESDKYPAVRRDLSLLINKAVTFSELEKIAFDSEKKLLRKVGLFDVYEGKNLEEGKKSYAVSFTLQDSDKTMTDQQVENSMKRIQQNLSDKLGATLRG
jgi:phenylalanyl-tRNA synthetase beta chain